MVDEFMVCVDRIQVVTASAAACLEQSSSSSFLVVNSGEIDRQLQQEEGEEEEAKVGKEKEGVGENVTCKNGIFGVGVEVGSSNLLKAKGSLIRECRICQEEDDESHLEAPCACNGTLKFAHRKCIQRWCNKKGDITCEICNQLFSPNYTSPPPKSTSDVMAIDIRQAWGPHIDLRDPRFLAFAAAERQFLQSEYDDYAIANTGTLSCFRSVAIILMLLLLIRQTLMLTRDFGMLQESSFFHYQISVLQLAGFLLPCYVVARSWYFVQCRRRRQG